jgi:hypothetical protein
MRMNLGGFVGAAEGRLARALPAFYAARGWLAQRGALDLARSIAPG